MAAAATGPALLRRRSTGNRVGPLPVAGLVVAEVALAAALLLLAVAPGLRWVAAVVLALGLALALSRRRGRWLTEWVVVAARFLVRRRTRTTGAPVQQITTADPTPAREHQLIGAEDARVASLRLLVPDLTVAERSDHEQQATGLAWSGGTWTAAMLVNPVPAVVSPLGVRSEVPLAPLAGCLRDRGVVLDSVTVVSHCYPGSWVLPAGSPVLAAYQEVLGPLPAVARRSTWVVVRLDPRRCPAAVHDRGGGVRGAQRALLGALSRVRGALDAAGLPHRVLNLDELLRAGLVTAELAGPAGSQPSHELALREHWSSVTTDTVHHRSYAVAGWTGSPEALSGLGSVRALSTTVSVALAPDADADAVRVRGLVRICARDSDELDAADSRLRVAARAAGIALERLSGQQAAAVRAGLPVGGAG